MEFDYKSDNCELVIIVLVWLDDFLADNSIKKSVNVYSMVEE